MNLLISLKITDSLFFKSYSIITRVWGGTVMTLPDLKEDEIPVTCVCTTRHHIISLHPILIKVLDDNGYELHDNKYYYVNDKKMDEHIKTAMQMEAKENERF